MIPQSIERTMVEVVRRLAGRPDKMRASHVAEGLRHLEEDMDMMSVEEAGNELYRLMAEIERLYYSTKDVETKKYIGWAVVDARSAYNQLMQAAKGGEE